MKLGFVSLLAVLLQGTATPDFVRKRSLQACSLGEGQVVCNATTNSPCSNTEVSNCQAGVFCRVAGACTSSSMNNSEVVCEVEGACDYTKFHRSNVTCYDVVNSCLFAAFYASAVVGQDSSRADAAFFDDCSCFTGTTCPSSGVVTCPDSNPNDVKAFCSKDVTCNISENPICRMQPTSTREMTPMIGALIVAVLAGLVIMV